MSRKTPFFALLGVAALLAAPPVAAQDFFSDLFGGGRARSAQPRGQEWGRSASSRGNERRHGQKSHDAKTGPAKPVPKAFSSGDASAEPPPAPYDAQLQRLAEILGGLAYLRDLCGSSDGEEWRKMMSRLLEADAPSGLRRQRMTAAFNRGFGGYEITYRACTPNARLVIARYLGEAEGLARDVAARYGNP